MSDNITTVDTLKYNTKGKVSVDGNVWEVKLPGAGTELKMSRYKRRQEFIAKKIENGTATEQDMDRYDEMEDFFFDFFRDMFQDGTKENKSVHEWVDNTPMAVILQAFEDIKQSANSNIED